MYLTVTGVHPCDVKPPAAQLHLSSHRELDQSSSLRIQTLTSGDLPQANEGYAERPVLHTLGVGSPTVVGISDRQAHDYRAALALHPALGLTHSRNLRSSAKTTRDVYGCSRGSS